MRVKALISFGGASICMAIGDERDINDDVLLKDLLKAGYVKPAEQSDSGQLLAAEASGEAEPTEPTEPTEPAGPLETPEPTKPLAKSSKKTADK